MNDFYAGKLLQNLYLFTINSPVNNVDPTGASPADVTKIFRIFREKVDWMTQMEYRNPDPYYNNEMIALYIISGGLLGKNYLGCGEQTYVVRGALIGNVFDDNWTFEAIIVDGGLHQMGKAHSANVSDPIIYFDSWRDNIYKAE